MSSTTRRLVTWAPAALALTLIACSGAEAPVDDSAGAHVSQAQSSERGRPTPALRAAVIAAAQVNASPVFDAALGHDGFEADNPSRGFRAHFRNRGVEVITGGGGAASRLSMRASSAGCPSAPQALADAEPEARANRVEMRRTAAVTEWYLNGPLGLEQGFTVAEPLACGTLTTDADGEDLVITIDLGGDLVPSLSEDGAAVHLAGPDGRVVLRYTDLFVRDAEGAAVPAHLELSGDRLSLHVADDGALYPLVIDPLIATEGSTIIDGDPASSDDFGDAIAMDGSTAVFGVNGKNSNTGAAYVFTESGGLWTQQAKLTPFDGLAYDNFGSSVALSGDTLVVGAYGADLGAFYSSGAGYIYVRSGTTWTLQQKVVAFDATSQANFGGAVAISGDTAVFTTGYSPLYPTVGAGYVFVRSAGVWTLEQKVVPSVPVGGGLGPAALDGDTMILGWPNDEVAYVFTRSAGSWTEQQKLQSVAPAIADNFGYSVALSGDTAFVGATADGTHGVSAGAVYVWDRSGSTWSNTDILFGTGISGLSYFGRALAVSNDTLVIGARGDGGSSIQYGAAWVYVRNAGTWSEQLKLVASDQTTYAWLGTGVAVYGDTAICGAPGFDGYGSNAGKAYVYTVPTAITGSCAGVPDGGACDDGDACTFGDTCAAGACVGTAEVDTDGDGVCDAIDNCPSDPNPSQLDLDHNGWGEACLSACIEVPRDYGSTADATISAAALGSNFNGATLVVSPTHSTLLSFDLSVLPAQTIVSSATITVGIYQTLGAAQINLHAITSPWIEGSVTYGNFANAYSPAVAASFANNQGASSVTVTSLVQSWLDGSVANYGTLLRQASGGTRIHSSESPAVGGNAAPKLKVCYTAPGY